MCSKNDIEAIKNKSPKNINKPIHNITLPLGCVFHHTLRSALHAEAVEELFSGQGWQGKLSDSFWEWAEQVLGELVHRNLQLPSLLGPWLVWVLGVELSQEVCAMGQIGWRLPSTCTPRIALPMHQVLQLAP